MQRVKEHQGLKMKTELGSCYLRWKLLGVVMTKLMGLGSGTDGQDLGSQKLYAHMNIQAYTHAHT